MEDRVTPLYDALIVGAGPAGAACAARLAEAGWKVLAVDRATPGRVRVCGGFLGPEFEDWVRAWGWNADLERLVKSTVSGVQISGEGSRIVRTDLPRGGFAVDRGVFDRWAADLAIARGAEVRTEATVEALGRTERRTEGRPEGTADDRAGSWLARIRANDDTGSGQMVRARHWVNAIGRRPAPAAKQTSAFFACKAVYRGATGLGDAVALHFVERGHVGLNPLSADEMTLCLCVDGRYLREAHGDADRMVRGFMRRNAGLAVQLGSARRVSPWKTCQAEPDDDPVFYRGGKFFIGDALSMVNPVIGGGIPIAMHSGILLADRLLRNRDEAAVAAEFERAWRKTFSKKFRFGKWLGDAERSKFASRLVMGALAAAPALLPRLVGMSRPLPAGTSAR